MLKEIYRPTEVAHPLPIKVRSEFTVTSDSMTEERVVLEGSGRVHIPPGSVATRVRPATVQKDYGSKIKLRKSSLQSLVVLHDRAPVVGVVKSVDWRELVALSESWNEVIQEIHWFAEQEAGWKGIESLQVNSEVSRDAAYLARNLAKALPDGPVPMVGADDEGSIVFTWNDQDLIGNLSVRGNKRFSYFIKRKGAVLKGAGQPVYSLLPEQLTDFLRS
jgi:hypothetical protein